MVFQAFRLDTRNALMDIDWTYSDKMNWISTRTFNVILSIQSKIKPFSFNESEVLYNCKMLYIMQNLS